MKCRPGDLCVIVNDMEHPENNGKFVTVLRRALDGSYSIPADWECRAESRLTLCGFEFQPGDDECGYRDRELQPIRDPGDDAVDETLGWLPAPSKDIQHAMDDLRAHIAQGTREKAGAA